jgi:hypothetical protein
LKNYKCGLQISEILFNKGIIVNRITHLNLRSKKLKPEDVAFRGKHGLLVLSFQEKWLVNMVSTLHRTETADVLSNRTHER